jgi:hypothetical protein
MLGRGLILVLPLLAATVASAHPTAHRGTVAQYGRRPGSSLARPVDRRIVRKRTPIDGVWKVTTTADDLRAVHAPADEIIPENYGDFVYVFDRGRFAFTQESDQACTWQYGTFTVRGHKMAWTFILGGGISPNRAFNKPGEFFRFGWSFYRNTLTLTALKGAISPEEFWAKPWQLVTRKPATRYFSDRCPPPKKALPRTPK